ncbi:fimbrial assembly protein, partial [Klebsiella michiganensis]
MTIKNNKLRPARLATLIAIALTGFSPELYASDSFNTALVELDNPGVGKADLSAFESGSQAPGTYHVDIILDDQLMDTRDIPFSMAKNGGGNEVLQ